MEETRQSKVILIADDDPDALDLVGLGVSTLGFQPVEARDGNEAWQKFEEYSPDLAVLDLMMPGLSGNDVCAKIKKSELGAHVPVIILTARDGLQDKVTALEGGADDYLTKPFHVPELQARLKALLRVRELNLNLRDKNQKLLAAQEKLIQQERQLLVMQLAGTAAHQLGQPLSAILLNCHLLEKISVDDARFGQALAAIKQDAKRMAELIERLKTVDPAKKESYHGEMQILDIKKD